MFKCVNNISPNFLEKNMIAYQDPPVDSTLKGV